MLWCYLGCWVTCSVLLIFRAVGLLFSCPDSGGTDEKSFCLLLLNVCGRTFVGRRKYLTVMAALEGSESRWFTLEFWSFPWWLGITLTSLRILVLSSMAKDHVGICSCPSWQRITMTFSGILILFITDEDHVDILWGFGLIHHGWGSHGLSLGFLSHSLWMRITVTFLWVFGLVCHHGWGSRWLSLGFWYPSLWLSAMM